MVNKEAPDVPYSRTTGSLPLSLAGSRTLPTLLVPTTPLAYTGSPFIAQHCEVTGTCPLVPVCNAGPLRYKDLLPWPWPPASLFHSLPYQHPLDSRSDPTVLHSDVFCLSSAAHPAAPSPSLWPTLLLSQTLYPSQIGPVTISSTHSLPTCPRAFAHTIPLLYMPFLPISSSSFFRTQLKCHLFREVSPARCPFSDPTAPVHLCQCLLSSLCHGLRHLSYL